MVAITILTLAVAGPLFTASRAIIAARAASNQLTASYLAQEGVEYVRMMRDNTYLAAVGSPTPGENASTTGWNNFRTLVAPCKTLVLGNAPFCTFDPVTPVLSACSGACTKLYLTNCPLGPSSCVPPNIYTQQNLSGSMQTMFTRTIQVFEVSGTASEEKIVSTVTWNFHNMPYTVTVTDHLTPWQSP